MVGVTIDAADKSGAENIREVAWVQQQVKAELNDLKNDVSVDKFYETEADGSIKYKMDLVKDYLNTLKDKEWNQLIQKNTSAWMMAVQIALEKLGYDTGKIDGIYKKGGTTDVAVRKFQAEHGLRADGAPGKLTIRKLLEELDVVLVPSVTAKAGVEVTTGGSLNPEDLLDNLPAGATAAFDGTPDFTTVGTQTINVKVTKADGTEETIACTYEVVDA